MHLLAIVSISCPEVQHLAELTNLQGLVVRLLIFLFIFLGTQCWVVDIMSRVMRKPAFCICENKDADQLRGNHEGYQRLSFPYIGSTIHLLPIYFKPLAILCGCTVRFVSDLVGNHEDRFSHKEAHLMYALVDNRKVTFVCSP